MMASSLRTGVTISAATSLSTLTAIVPPRRRVITALVLVSVAITVTSVLLRPVAVVFSVPITAAVRLSLSIFSIIFFPGLPLIVLILGRVFLNGIFTHADSTVTDVHEVYATLRLEIRSRSNDQLSWRWDWN